MPKEQCEIDNVGNVSLSVGTYLNPFLNVSYVFGLSIRRNSTRQYKKTKSELKKKKDVKSVKRNTKMYIMDYKSPKCATKSVKQTA